MKGFSLRDQREAVGGADQLLVHEFLDSEIRKLLAVARPLDSTERQVRRAHRGVIDEDHACFDFAGDTLSAIDVLGINGTAQTVRRIVGNGYRLFLVFGRKNERDGAEELLPVRGIVGGYIGEDRRLYEGPLAIDSLASGEDLRAMRNCLIDLSKQQRERCLG